MTAEQAISIGAAAGVPRKGLFLLVDALRYDVLADAASREAIAPNIARLARRGFIRRVVTNAQATQFVTPSIFSLTYPLDYGGYNNGIRERPQSFVETIRDAGFETHMMASANQIGITMGFDRGFDSVRTTSDYRTLVEQRITRTLSYDLQLWVKGERSEAETIAIVQREFDMLLERLEHEIDQHDKSIWPERLRRLNARVAKGCSAEREILTRDPLAIMRKLLRIPAGIYWRFLGQEHVGKLPWLFWRTLGAVSWRVTAFANDKSFIPFLMLAHYPVLANDVITPICDFVRTAKDRRWFIYMHVMDVHDCRAINRPLHLIGRLRYFPRWLKARLAGKTRRNWVYDSAVMYVDAGLGRLFDTLEATEQMDDTVVLVTGDHGQWYAESPRKKKLPIGQRTHYEDIEVPLLLSNSGKPDSGNGLIDSMGVSATFLESLNISLHQSHKGISAFGDGRQAVISENCGGGNADIERRDIYFTVTTETHRMMAVLRGQELSVDRLFDRRQDPREVNNIVKDARHHAVISTMLDHLYRERADILTLRRVLPNRGRSVLSSSA